MVQPIKLTQEQLELIKRGIAIVFPGSKFKISDQGLIKTRKNYAYDRENVIVHWIEFIYKMLFPIIVKYSYYGAQNLDKNYGLYHNTPEYIFNHIKLCLDRYDEAQPKP